VVVCRGLAAGNKLARELIIDSAMCEFVIFDCRLNLYEALRVIRRALLFLLSTQAFLFEVGRFFKDTLFRRG
jgi:hypothetical protein